MTLEALDPEEREVVRRTMKATFRYFDFDFQSRLGISPDVMQRLLDAWPAANDARDNSDACLAINNSLNDLIHGVGIGEAEAMELVGVNLAEMLRVYRKWAAARGWESTGVQ
ncbi:MAG: hypothetical protein K2X38_15625 [Gemmataceae bacterium]|nr:hypothetical protein [Gemmataceae bacterium]